MGQVCFSRIFWHSAKPSISGIDDEAEIADLIEAYLTGENYTVFKFYMLHHCRNGPDCTCDTGAVGISPSPSAPEGEKKPGQSSTFAISHHPITVYSSWCVLWNDVICAAERQRVSHKLKLCPEKYLPIVEATIDGAIKLEE